MDFVEDLKWLYTNNNAPCIHILFKEAPLLDSIGKLNKRKNQMKN